MDAHRVVGRDRPVEEGPVRPAGVLRAQPGEGPPLPPRASSSCSWATKSGLLVTGRNMRPRLGATGSAGDRWALVPSGGRSGESEYPTRDAATPQARPRRPVPVRRGVPVAALPRTRPRSTPARRCAPSASRPRRSCSSPWAPGSFLRMDRLELVGLVVQPVPPDLGLRRQPHRPRLPARRDHRRLPGGRVDEHRPGRAATAGSGRASLPRDPLSIAGLLAVLLVMAGSHVVVARYDMLALDALNSGCIFVGQDVETECEADASESPDPSATRRADRRAVGQRRPTARSRASARPSRGLDPAVGRQGAPEHPAHRRRQAGRRPPHRHARSRCRSTRSPRRSRCSACRATRWTCRSRPGPARSLWGRSFRPEDQQLLRPELPARRHLAGQAERARLQRPQVDPGRAVRPGHQVLRRGRLRRLQGGRRRRRRRDRQRPDPGRRRHLPGRRRAAACGCTSRAACST